MKTFATIVAAIVGLLIIGAILAILLAFPVMWLWNYAVVGTIAGVAPLTFWKALALMLLSSFLFKSSGVSSSKKD